MLQAPESSAATRGHIGSGKALRTSTYAMADSTPPPKPWTNRPATTMPIVGAIAQTSAPMPKTTAPAQKAVRAPSRAVRCPVQVAATIDEARNAVVGQLIMAVPPTSSTMLGKTVASISTFMECRRTPPTSATRSGNHCGFSSVDQPTI